MKKQEKTTSLDTLAVMVSRGFEQQSKKIDGLTKESNGLKADLNGFRAETIESFKKVRRDILELNDKFVTRHEFDRVLSRLSILESKVKGK